MEIVKVLNETENPLFKRKEIVFEIHSEVTPSKEDVRKISSEKFKISPDAARIMKIEGKFGDRNFLVSIHSYKTKEDMLSIEHFSKKEKEAMKKAEEAAAPKEEPKSEEKPAEDTKEEKTEEKK